MLTLTQIDAIRNNLNEYVKSELDGIIPQKINTIFQILEEGNNNNLSEILPVRDAKTPENEVDPLTHKVMYNRELNEYSVIEASDDDYNLVEHTSECS